METKEDQVYEKRYNIKENVVEEQKFTAKILESDYNRRESVKNKLVKSQTIHLYDDKEDNNMEVKKGFRNFAVIEQDDPPLNPIQTQNEIAVIGFWTMDIDTQDFFCYKYLIVPDPIKKTVKKEESTNFYQVLFTGQDGEVFFFCTIDGEKFICQLDSSLDNPKLIGH